MHILRDEPTWDKLSYFDNGFQYYLVGRAAFFMQLMPVCGNLFHHAVELILLSGLISTNSPQRLKDKYKKHNIPNIWFEFKNLFPKEKLDRFDKYINKLHQWSELRYPRKVDHDVSMLFSPEKSDNGLLMQKIEGRRSKEYHLVLEETDEFVERLVHILAIGQNQIKFLTSFGSGEREKIYKKLNKHVI